MCHMWMWFKLEFLGFVFFFINGKGVDVHSCPSLFGTLTLPNFDFFLVNGLGLKMVDCWQSRSPRCFSQRGVKDSLFDFDQLIFIG